jgi:predicted RecB family nuclease
VSRLWGVGPKAERALARLGIRTVGDLRSQSVERLRRAFGERADQALRRINAGMERVSAVLVPLLLLGIGAFFVVDAAWYWARGEPLVVF